MSKEEFINYISYFEPQLNITVSEYSKNPLWVEIKLNEPKNDLDKIIVFVWKKYVISLYDKNDNHLEYNEYFKKFDSIILETKEETLLEICNIIAPEISNYILV